jgi:phosphocarrier protein HPr
MYCHFVVYYFWIEEILKQQGGVTMKSLTVQLTTTESVKKFVDIVSRYAFDIDLRSGRYVVDAKSILGIFSLDLSKPITLEIQSEDCADLLEQLKDFAV